MEHNWSSIMFTKAKSICCRNKTRAISEREMHTWKLSFTLAACFLAESRLSFQLSVSVFTHSRVPHWSSIVARASALPPPVPFPTCHDAGRIRESHNPGGRTLSRSLLGSKMLSAGGLGYASYTQTPFFKTRCLQSNPK